METFNPDPKPGRIVLPLVLIGMIATTYTFINRVATNNDLDLVTEETPLETIEEEIEVLDTSTTSTTTTLPDDYVQYLEEISAEKNAHEKLDYLLFSFVNHGSHSYRTIEDDRLIAAISYSINNAKLLKSYRPMKRRKFSGSRIHNFKKLILVVKEESAEIIKWFVENTVSHHLVRYFTNTQLILCG